MIRPYPALVFVICGVVSQVCVKYSSSRDMLPTNVVTLTSVVLLILGCSVLMQSIMQFKKMKTTIHPFGNPSKLITTAAFSYSRNPVYLGLLLLLAAQSVYGNTVLGFSGMVAFFVVIDNVIIPKEEKLLKQLFKKDYTKYADTVARWILFY